MIPIHVLTGFLGSGKTTLLRRLLQHPEMGRTAVIVNEFGEVGIDQDLLATSDEDFVQLTNGCLCCRIRTDLGRTLGALAARRATDPRGGFERVVIETSGLADPVPIVNALRFDPQARADFQLAGIIATVDGVLGRSALDRYVETARQVAVSDCVVITKVDRSDACPEALERAVQQMRPGMPVLRSGPGSLRPSVLFGTSNGTDAGLADARPVRVPAAASVGFGDAPRHTRGIASIVIARDAPLRAATLPLFLAAMAENYAADLLRLKGIVGIVEAPDRPAVVHGVQHVYDEPEWLPAWPGSDRTTRIVCIGHRLHAEWIRALLDLLDAEVADEARRRR